MPEIESLTIRARELGQSVDLWNLLMLWGLGLAAVAAVFVVIATRVVVTRTGQLATTQELLSAAKDRQLKSELAEKDVDIAAANKKAADAQERVAGAEAGTAAAKLDAARAAEATEREKIERLKLEAQIAPRRLAPEQIQAISEECMRFRGRTVSVVSYTLDPESAVLAKQIISALNIAEVRVQDRTASSSPMGGFLLGVHVSGLDNALVTSLRQILPERGNLTVAPSESPRTIGLESGFGPMGPPPDAVITVGVKPIQ